MRQNFMNFALDGLVHSPHTAAARRRTYSSWEEEARREDEGGFQMRNILCLLQRGYMVEY